MQIVLPNLQRRHIPENVPVENVSSANKLSEGKPIKR